MIKIKSLRQFKAGTTAHLPDRIFNKAFSPYTYHILPDVIMANPLHFFHPRFLRSTFVPGRKS